VTWGSPGLEMQAEYFAHLREAPSADVREGDGYVAVRTGAASNTENGVVCSGADVPVDELVDRLRGAPASWLCTEDVHDDALLVSALVAAGCRPETASWEMWASLDAIELPARDVAVRVAEDEAGVAAWLDLAASNGWFDDPSERGPFERLYRELALRDDARVVLYRAGEDAFASAFYGDGTVLLTQLVVVERARRRGIGTELARVRLEEARRRGCARAVLSPSREGLAFYQRLGFALARTPPGRWFYLPC